MARTSAILTASEVLLIQTLNGGVLNLNETTAPSATANVGKVYVKSSDSKLYFKNDSGVEFDLTAGGGGTVSSVSVVTANGVSGSVANATTTPAITLTLGAITPTSVAASGTVTGSNLSGTNTGDQTSIVGITGTKAQFDTAVTDGNFLYVGDVTQYTDEMAQDAVGAMIDTTLVYVDGTPLLTRAALTGDITAPQASNVTTLATVNANVGSFGSSTAIPSFTVNGKGLITAASTNAVIAPAGTLTGATLAAGVTASSLTSVGTLTGGATGAGFTIALGTSTLTGDLPFANLAQGSARSVLGVTGNSTADVASIQGTTDQVLRINGAGTALAFGAIDISKSAAVTGLLSPANGGHGADISTIAKGGLVVGSGAGTFGITTVGTDGFVLTADAASANGVKWAAGGSGAPSTATYITQTPDAGLSAEQALSALATGILKNTTTTGVLSIATEGTDYYKPGGTDVAVADGGTGASTAAGALGNLGAAANANIQIFTSTGANTWTKPTGAKVVRVVLISGGGGGGSGRKGAEASNRFGGGGGSGAGVASMTFDASVLGPTVTATVGAGGTGGVAQSTNSTNGNGGNDGGTTSFGSLFQARVGLGGNGGTTTTGTAGNAVSTMAEGWSSGSGQAGGTGGSGVGSTASSNGTYSPQSGAGGGGRSSANASSIGGVGAGETASASSVYASSLNGGTAGAVETTGGAGNSRTVGLCLGGSGGGGGGSSNNVAAGGDGGAGGLYGAGGGGGGAGVDSVGNSGKGGDGANGVAFVITYF